MSCLPRHRGRQYVAIGLKRLMPSGGRKGGFVDLAAGLGLLFCLAQLQYCSALNPDIDLRRMFFSGYIPAAIVSSGRQHRTFLIQCTCIAGVYFSTDWSISKPKLTFLTRVTLLTRDRSNYLERAIMKNGKRRSWTTADVRTLKSLARKKPARVKSRRRLSAPKGLPVKRRLVWAYRSTLGSSA